MKSVFRRIMLPIAKQKLAFSRLARRYPGQPMSFFGRDGGFIIVASYPPPRQPWRAVSFDRAGMPVGFVDAATHRAALDAAREYGANPSTVQFFTRDPQELHP